MSRISRITGGMLGKNLGDLNLSVGINLSLAWCLGSHPAGSSLLGTELVSRNVGTLNGTSAFSADHPTESWKGLDTPTFTDNWSVALSAAFKTALDGTNDYSVAIHQSLTDGESSGVLFCVPWFDSSWAYPFRLMGLHRQGLSSTGLQHVFSDGVDRKATGSTAGDNWLPDGNPHWVGFARTGFDYDWYADGSLIQSKVAGTANLGFNPTGSSKMVLGSRSDVSPAEGCKVKFHSMSIWNRLLSPSEFSSLNSDPTQQFIT